MFDHPSIDIPGRYTNESAQKRDKTGVQRNHVPDSLHLIFLTEQSSTQESAD
ncbi:MAG: hypothetical protein HY360_02005 [Verrucomicrobia bacterium]|nr:hypothetical protein [Verrucomicrobiota bacterium]